MPLFFQYFFLRYAQQPQYSSSIRHTLPEAIIIKSSRPAIFNTMVAQALIITNQ